MAQTTNVSLFIEVQGEILNLSHLVRLTPVGTDGTITALSLFFVDGAHRSYMGEDAAKLFEFIGKLIKPQPSGLPPSTDNGLDFSKISVSFR